MAKHAHQLVLLNKKTWRCKIDGCSFFVHLGLQHILENKMCICNECGELFKVDARSLKEDMPRCNECRDGIISSNEEIDFEAHIRKLTAQGKLTVIPEEEDEIEVIEIEESHAADCSVYSGGDCDCK